MSANRPELEVDYTVAEVAAALGRSPKWVRARIKIDKVAHQRYGNKIMFTRAQVDALRALFVRGMVSDPVTTGPSSRRAS